MIEILVIYQLCKNNRNIAISHGHDPGGYVALTIALWFGLEIVGLIVGFTLGLGLGGAYALGLPAAALGGAISYMIVKKSKPEANRLRLDIVCEEGENASWSFTLNGEYIGSLKSCKRLTAYTNEDSNVLVAKDDNGRELAPFKFGMQTGGSIELYFTANRFMPERSRGLLEPRTA